MRSHITPILYTIQGQPLRIGYSAKEVDFIHILLDHLVSVVKLCDGVQCGCDVWDIPDRQLHQQGLRLSIKDGLVIQISIFYQDVRKLVLSVEDQVAIFGSNMILDSLLGQFRVNELLDGDAICLLKLVLLDQLTDRLGSA